MERCPSVCPIRSLQQRAAGLLLWAQWAGDTAFLSISRSPVLDCGTTFHLDSGGRDLPSTLSDNLRKLIYLATEALSDFFEFIGAI